MMSWLSKISPVYILAAIVLVSIVGLAGTIVLVLTGHESYAASFWGIVASILAPLLGLKQSASAYRILQEVQDQAQQVKQIVAITKRMGNNG
jgi:hypothetical protein